MDLVFILCIIISRHEPQTLFLKFYTYEVCCPISIPIILVGYRTSEDVMCWVSERNVSISIRPALYISLPKSQFQSEKSAQSVRRVRRFPTSSLFSHYHDKLNNRQRPRSR